ncbi:MAG: DUF4433 domain-containing protein [Bacteroidetes bacterium]|nr:DUF4433 domain-containing protein [Bacteroidota bacterium]
MPGIIPIPTPIYRIVHYQNVEYILRNGIYTRGHANHDPNYVNIGNTQLIADRHDYPVKIEGCGNLGEYVPFYLGPHSPMLYNIKTGYGVARFPQSEIVYFISNAQRVAEEGLPFVFTNGHAKNSITTFYNNLDDLNAIDWGMVVEKQWSPIQGDRDRMRRKQAEFLIHTHVPISLIDGIVVYNQEKFNFVDTLMKQIGLTIPLSINTNLYY